MMLRTTLVLTAMDPTVDLTNALQVLGLASIPSTNEELARSVAAHHPASRAWSSAQSAAYRTVWEALDPAGGTARGCAGVTSDTGAT